MFISRKSLFRGVIVIGGLLLALNLSAIAEYSKPQAKLLARRAARVDAIRNLTETIYGTRIDSDTSVKDLVTQSDKIRSRMEALIKGANEVGCKYHPDDSAEVTMAIKVGLVTDILGSTVVYDGETFSAIGVGAPPSEEQPKKSENEVKPVAKEDPAKQVIKATGLGAEPSDPNMSAAQKKAMGFRSATMDAQRNLLERVMGIRITSDTYVVDLVTKNDQIRAQVEGFIKDARIIDKRVNDGVYEVDVEMDQATLIKIMK